MRRARFLLVLMIGSTGALAASAWAASARDPTGPHWRAAAPVGAFPALAGTLTLAKTTGCHFKCLNAALVRQIRLPDGARLSIVIANGSLPAGTQITAYAGNRNVLASHLPASMRYVEAFAIGWTAPGGSLPRAGHRVLVTLHELGISGRDVVYETTATGVGNLPRTDQASPRLGVARFAFNHDPGFVLAAKNSGHA